MRFFKVFFSIGEMDFFFRDRVRFRGYIKVGYRFTCRIRVFVVGLEVFGGN